MRIRDWSSDVCSSDLRQKSCSVQKKPVTPSWRLEVCGHGWSPGQQGAKNAPEPNGPDGRSSPAPRPRCSSVRRASIGRASCWARVCQYVEISVVAVYFKHKNQITQRHQLTTIT